MPKPNHNESENDFMTRCIPVVLKEGTAKDNSQAVAMCHSIFREDKEIRYCYKSILEIKEDSQEYIVKGYIATTHFDGQDIITKSALDKWANEINDGNPRANKISVNHNRETHVTGVGIKGTAKVDKFPDGAYGLYVEGRLDRTKEDIDKVKYRIENDLLDSFSIEYVAPDKPRYDTSVGARILDESTELYGWTLASRPMNEYAVMIKEIISKTQIPINTNMEETRMDSQTSEVKEQQEVETHQMKELKEFKISDEDAKLLAEVKENRAKEIEDAKWSLRKKEILDEFKKSIESVKIEEKVQINPGKSIEVKELVEFKEIMKPSNNLSRDSVCKVVGKISDMVGFTSSGEIAGSTRKAESKLGSYKFDIKEQGCKHVLEYKGLGLTTNQNTDTDYLLSAAELSDVFDPLVFNMLNQATVTWNVLRKEDYSNKGNNQVQFTGKTVANSTAGAYTGNSVSTGNVTRLKFQTKFKKYQVGVEVDGDMIAAARGGPVGDVFAREVADSTDDLMADMNVDLYAEVGLETAAGVIGFEYITDNAGNGTLYNLTRSTTNLLAPASNTDTYINGSSADITLANLRAAKRQAIKEGAKIENLVFFTDHIQGDKFRGLYDNIQRTVPTSSRFGFEGRPDFDGIPIFEDKDCNDDDWFLVDLETHKIAIWVPPTVEKLGKDADSEKSFIKTYWCTYNRAPRRMVQIYGNATT